LGREALKLTADTNVLLRAFVEDDAAQSPIAQAELAAADLVAIPIPVLCEFVWVLTQSYGVSPATVAVKLRGMLAGANVLVDLAAAEAGLAMLDAGGDFADGVIAVQGRWLGADAFLTFDRKAARLLRSNGETVRLL